MQNVPANVFTRDDTFLGVCQALGEDFGFPPTLLRVALSIALFFNPVLVIGIYLGLGAIVLASRLLVRAPRRAAAPEVTAAVALRGDNDGAQAMAAAA